MEIHTRIRLPNHKYKRIIHNEVQARETVARSACPHKEDAERLRSGKMFCTLLNRTVKIRNSCCRCSDCRNFHS
jgi:hypothetical protein